MWKILKKIYSKIPKKLRTKKAYLIILILITSYIVLTRGDANNNLIETTTAQKKTIVSEVFSTGDIESENDVSLNFAVGGEVIWIPVKESDYIKKGQAIASIDKEKYEIALRQAQQDVVATDAVLQKTYDSLNDEDSVESYADKVTRTAAEAAKNKAFDAMKLAERNLKDTILISPVDGTLLDLNIKVGDEIFATETAARVVDLENTNFVSEIDEGDIGRIKKNQPAYIYLEAFPDTQLNSSVESIALESKKTSTDSTVIEVKFKVPQKENIILGMNGDIQIEIDRKENVFSIPIEALFEENKVWAKSGGKFVHKTVETGIENDSEVEIKSGLKEGDEVVISGFEEIGKRSIFEKYFLRK